MTSPWRRPRSLKRALHTHTHTRTRSHTHTHTHAVTELILIYTGDKITKVRADRQVPRFVIYTTKLLVVDQTRTKAGDDDIIVSWYSGVVCLTF
jgi:hypothetical protein